MITEQLEMDLRHTYGMLSAEETAKLENASIVVTGCAGFLGFYLLHFLYRYREELHLKHVVCLDNFMLGHPEWMDKVAEDGGFVIERFDVIRDEIGNIPEAGETDYVIHMASIASPVFYRRYPLQTLDANIWGLRRLLDHYKQKPVKGFLFFSSSEIYGDPAPGAVPTTEGYYGNVCCTGPRACYDESKRFGETMCMLFAKEYGLPVGIARPFNNYGPGMKLNDKRVPADFAKNIVEGRDIRILSDGSPSRTFCHIADAMAGYLKILLHGSYDYFNIGIDGPEITIGDLAAIYRRQGEKLFGYQGSVIYEAPQESEYLTNNPQRRCPDITKAQEILGYRPSIHVEDGIARFLRFIKESQKENLLW